MELGKPISGIPNPAALSGTAPQTGQPTPPDREQHADSRGELPHPASGDGPHPPRPIAEDKIKIPMPGSWKFFQAFLFFCTFLFAGNITANLLPSAGWRLGVLAVFAPTYLMVFLRIITASISGSAVHLEVPSAGGVLRRQLVDVASVALPDPQFNRSGAFRMTFAYGDRQSFRLAIVILQQQSSFGGTPTQRTVDTKWIYTARAALHSVGIRTIYSGAGSGPFAQFNR